MDASLLLLLLLLVMLAPLFIRDKSVAGRH